MFVLASWRIFHLFSHCIIMSFKGLPSKKMVLIHCSLSLSCFLYLKKVKKLYQRKNLGPNQNYKIWPSWLPFPHLKHSQEKFSIINNCLFIWLFWFSHQRTHLDGLVFGPPRLVLVLVAQPAPLHGRGVLGTELLVPGRQLRVVPPQLLQRRQLLLVGLFLNLFGWVYF